MQSSYGGVSEMQQFMVESCGGSTPSLFSNTADIHSAAAGGSNPLKYQEPQAPSPAAVLPPHFAHFHSIPITQQPPPAAVHQFQLFHPHHQQQLNYQPVEPRRMQMPHHQHLGLDQDSGPENSASSARVAMPAGGGGGGGGVPLPSFLAEAMNFKLAVNESSGGGSREGINNEDGILRGGGDDGSESRLHHWPQRDDESSMKELSWRPLDLDIDFINNKNNKSCKNKEPDSSINTAGKVSKKSRVDAGAGSSNYKIFSELEAIYKAGGSGGGVNQTGSGSALTGDETLLLHTAAMAPPGLPAGADCVGGGMSETSAGEEAGRPGKKFSNNRNSSGRRRRKRRRWQRRLSSVVAFFESLVKQLMDHQESLHRKFLEAMESRELDRTSREEAWRKQEAAKSSREAAARAHERKLASSREAAIIAFLEKITGESLNVPPKPQFSDENNNNHKSNPQTDPYTEEAAFGDQESNKVQFSTSRWPKTEVQALIRVRSGLESRFQEPGLKGPLWEEVSATMAVMGYLRSAKRCKEKWENINKYFRKTKESGKKRPQHSKTCPYFQQLDQLYSRSSLKKGNIPKEQRLTDLHHDSKEKHDGAEDKRNDNSELLDAIVVPPAAADYFPSLKFGFDFNGKLADENLEEGGSAPNSYHNGDENEEGEEQGRGGEEVKGDQEIEEEEEDQEPKTPHHLDQEVDGELHDTSLFFQRLRS